MNKENLLVKLNINFFILDDEQDSFIPAEYLYYDDSDLGREFKAFSSTYLVYLEDALQSLMTGKESDKDFIPESLYSLDSLNKAFNTSEHNTFNEVYGALFKLDLPEDQSEDVPLCALHIFDFSNPENLSFTPVSFEQLLLSNQYSILHYIEYVKECEKLDKDFATEDISFKDALLLESVLETFNMIHSFTIEDETSPQVLFTISPETGYLS